MTRGVWVSLPYATFGIEIAEGQVVDAAPIARWMVGKPVDKVVWWVRNRGGRMVLLPSDSEGE